MNEKQYKINDHITLKLQYESTYVYVDDVEISLCKHIAVTIPITKLETLQEINSIDDLEDKFYQKINEEDIENKRAKLITPETEFLVHCSNIQAWAEHGYDSRLIHSSLAFPLLKRLNKVGDLQAKRVFKEEIVKRYLDGNENVQRFLAINEYLNKLSLTEQSFLFKEHAQEIREMGKIIGYRIKIVGDVKLLPGLELLGGEIVGLKITGKGRIFIPDQISLFRSLKTLILDDFLNKSVPDWIGNLTKLECLDLSNNKIEKIPESIGNLKNLKNLSVRNNNLKGLPNSISTLKGVESFDISNNSFEEFPPELLSMTNLSSLDMTKNKIKKLPSEIKNLTSLWELFLANNPLEIIPDELFKLPELETVLLQNCKAKLSVALQALIKKRKIKVYL